MSRKVVYCDDRIIVISGLDHVLGKFTQMYDKNMRDETPEEEGLILDWSEFFGLEVNYTGMSGKLPIETIIQKYIEENK